MSNRRGYGYYGERIVSLAIGNPEVDASDMDEVEEYAREMAEKLCLDPEPLSRYTVSSIGAVTGDDFATAKSERERIRGFH